MNIPGILVDNLLRQSWNEEGAWGNARFGHHHDREQHCREEIPNPKGAGKALVLVAELC
jgi:hypothetical protein